MTTKELLVKARNRIEGHWRTGALGRTDTLDGQVCAIGGVISVMMHENQEKYGGRRQSERIIYNNPCVNELLEIGRNLNHYPALRRYAEMALGETGPRLFIGAIESFNDRQLTERPVLKLFDEMIEVADRLGY